MSIDYGPQFDRVAEILAGAEKVLLTAHRGPDGDSIGSMVALAVLLRAQGKKATLFNPDLVPRHLKWLPHTKGLIHRLKPNARFDATVVVDCGDRHLLGKDFPGPEITGPLVALDHHRSGNPFGDVFYSDPDAAAVSVIVNRLAERLGWDIPEEAALGMWVSLISDTGSFRYANANAEAFRLGAKLVDVCGVDPWRVHEQMSERVPFSRYKLLGRALDSLELVCDGHIAIMTITSETVRLANAAWEDTEGLVNYSRSIDGVECGVLITPAKGGGIRVSLRSKANIIDAGALCSRFGGGGHPGAAGCRLQGKLKEARRTIEKALRDELIAGGVKLSEPEPVKGQGRPPATQPAAAADK